MGISSETNSSAGGARFEFGKNWSRYFATINDAAIASAVESLKDKLATSDLSGRTFIDIGCGSGLFSLAALRLGADVVSFDYDLDSVRTAMRLRDLHASAESAWRIDQGSVLDRSYLETLGRFDVVYSWGVLHHTGEMWIAIENATAMVRPGGTVFIAIYNDQGRYSRWWLRIKELYNWLPRLLRLLVLVPCFIRLRGPMLLRDLVHGHPLRTWRSYGRTRGMSPWYDVVDWVGGLPFEVAKPDEIFDFFRRRGFVLSRLKTCAGGRGCNEYVFVAQDLRR
jgi:2-polyprenyl-6-hydroxyphenyl methylase/3-demethylubiquinone-9 3-methyltransferase